MWIKGLRKSAYECKTKRKLFKVNWRYHVCGLCFSWRHSSCLECQLVLRRALLWWLEIIEVSLKFCLFVNNRGKSCNVCWTFTRTVERKKNVGGNVLGWITGSKSLNRIHHQFSLRILSDFYVVGKNGKIFATSGKPHKSSHKRDRSKYGCRIISIPFASNKEDAFARKFSCAEASKRW